MQAFCRILRGPRTGPLGFGDPKNRVTRHRHETQDHPRHGYDRAKESRSREAVDENSPGVVAGRQRAQRHDEECRPDEEAHTEDWPDDPRAEDLHDHDRSAGDEHGRKDFNPSNGRLANRGSIAGAAPLRAATVPEHRAIVPCYPGRARVRILVEEPGACASMPSRRAATLPTK